MLTLRLQRLLQISGILIVLIGALYAIHAGVEVVLFTQRIERIFGLWTEESVQCENECVLRGLYFTFLGTVITVSSRGGEYFRSVKNLLDADLKKLLAAMVLSGGTVFTDKSEYKYAVRFYGRDLILHDVFSRLLRRTHRIDVKTSSWSPNSSYVTQIYSKCLVEDLLLLSPAYNTRNGAMRQGRDSVVPSAAFLVESDDLVAMESIRLMMSSNGSVQYTAERKGHSDEFFIKPKLAFGYLSPPELLDDYSHLLRKMGMNTFKVFDRRFKDKGFIMSSSWKNMEIFDKIGGFVPDVKIGSGRYEGVERNAMVNGLLSFSRRERNNFSSKESACLNLEKYINAYQ